MGQVQEYPHSVKSDTTVKHSSSSFRLHSRHRIYRCLLIGCAVTLILTLMEALILVFINPLSILGNTHNRLSALLLLPIHSPLYLLVPLCEFLLISVAIFFVLKPLALYSYMRIMQHEQQSYNTRYHPITIPAHIIADARTSVTTESAENTDAADDLLSSSQRQELSLVDVMRQQQNHLFLLGDPGIGKTTALHVYLYGISQPSLSFALSPGQLPIYVSLQNYSLFLKQRQLSSASFAHDEDVPYNPLLQYMVESNLLGLHLLRPYLLALCERGQLLLLCDGFDEVDRADRALVIDALVFLMRRTTNRLIITSREMDYREQEAFVQLVEDGTATKAVFYPMQSDQMHELVESFVEHQDKRWRYTAGQMMQLIEHSRLSYHARNPMMTFALMHSIDRVGIEREKQIDTRGQLVREYAVQLFADESRQPQWRRTANVPAQEEVFQFLSTLACAIWWSNSGAAIQLPVTTPSSLSDRRGNVDFAALAEALTFWLEEHPPQLPFAAEDLETPVAYGDYARLLQFAIGAALIELTPNGILRFSHAYFTTYFVADYFSTADQDLRTLTPRADLVDDAEHWCQPVAFWAGLLEDPLELAESFGSLALLDRAFLPYAVALGLICVGVLVTPPQADLQRPVTLPANLEQALSLATHNRPLCEALSHILTLCAENGTPEAYYALLPLLMVDGVDELLILLDQDAIPAMLFQHLQDAADHPDYEADVKRLTRLLSRFGGVVVERATQLSLPVPGRSLRLRAATINILGGTFDQKAVKPLIALLSDEETVVVDRAAHALFRLGATLALASLLRALEDDTPNTTTLRVHRAILHVLRRFTEEQEPHRQVSERQYQQIVDHLLLILTPQYQFEPEIQLQVRGLLVDQARMAPISNTDWHYQRGQQVVTALINSLSVPNGNAIRQVLVVLQEIGPFAVPFLIAALHHQSELVRVRVIEVLQTIRDISALPALLALVDDPAPTIRQQVSTALRSFAPECIPELLTLLLTSSSDSEAEAVTQVLTSIGEPVVEPVINALPVASPARARLLVYILDQIHDSRAVPALIALQERSRTEPLLAVTLVQALGQFREKQVVVPLIEQLASTNPQLYEEAVTALSQLGEIALPDLLLALDNDQETMVQQRIQRAILGMSPFPGELLVQALEQSSETQAMQIQAIFVQQGSDAAFVLVQYLLHPDERVRTYIYQALEQMQDVIVVPALLYALYAPELREAAGAFLLKYPAVAIMSLVELLGEPERGNAAAVILPQFGPVILRTVIAAFEDQRVMARELATRIIITLVRQSSDPNIVLNEVVELFSPPLPPNSRDQLIDLLTHELADVSMLALLPALEDARLLEPVTDALSRLAQRPNMQDEVLDNLIEALFVAERRFGGAETLIKIGAPAVNPVGRLITAQDSSVAQTAKQILVTIGVPALPFIWMAHSDRSNPQRRAAAMEVFLHMSADVIKDELVTLLVSENRDDTAMAVSLLLERVHEENKQGYANHVMVPELIDYVQSHHMSATNLRIIALLLLLGEPAFFDHLLDALEKTPQPRKQFLYLFLLMGDKSQKVMLDTFDDPDTENYVRAELAAILTLLRAPKGITDYAHRGSVYGLAKNGKQVAFPEKLAISLRSIGGLLASGQWNMQRLLEMRDRSVEGEPARELFNVLLGWRYEPVISRLEEEMDVQRESFKKKALLLTEKIMEEQKRAQGLEADLEKLQEEHGIRGDELQRIIRDRDNLRANISKMTKENTDLRSGLEQSTKARNTLNAQLERLKREYATLQLQYQQQTNRPTQ